MMITRVPCDGYRVGVRVRVVELKLIRSPPPTRSFIFVQKFSESIMHNGSWARFLSSSPAGVPVTGHLTPVGQPVQ